MIYSWKQKTRLAIIRQASSFICLFIMHIQSYAYRLFVR